MHLKRSWILAVAFAAFFLPFLPADTAQAIGWKDLVRILDLKEVVRVSLKGIQVYENQVTIIDENVIQLSAYLDDVNSRINSLEQLSTRGELTISKWERLCELQVEQENLTHELKRLGKERLYWNSCLNESWDAHNQSRNLVHNIIRNAIDNY